MDPTNQPAQTQPQAAPTQPTYPMPNQAAAPAPAPPSPQVTPPPSVNPGQGMPGAPTVAPPPPPTTPGVGDSVTPGGKVSAGKPQATDKKKGSSTQNSLLISEIRDGMAIMRDGSLRAVVMCQSINFDLMSPNEREAVEFSYQGFLNSLYFPVQIFIRSQRVDLKNYIDKLEQIHSNQENILLGLLMEDYIAYVRYLVEAANIMDKQFYVVVPYFPPLVSKEGVADSLRKLSTIVKPAKQTVVINETDFNKYKTELTQQVQVVLNGLQQMNIQSVPLNTQELIELYYNIYNPQTAASERLTNIDDLESDIVEKGQGQAPTVLQGEA